MGSLIFLQVTCHLNTAAQRYDQSWKAERDWGETSWSPISVGNLAAHGVLGQLGMVPNPPFQTGRPTCRLHHFLWNSSYQGPTASLIWPEMTETERICKLVLAGALYLITCHSSCHQEQIDINPSNTFHGLHVNVRWETCFCTTGVMPYSMYKCVSLPFWVSFFSQHISPLMDVRHIPFIFGKE